jgi:hypothetical protein
MLTSPRINIPDSWNCSANLVACFCSSREMLVPLSYTVPWAVFLTNAHKQRRRFTSVKMERRIFWDFLQKFLPQQHSPILVDKGQFNRAVDECQLGDNLSLPPCTFLTGPAVRTVAPKVKSILWIRWAR